jgi:hypothetical protein
MIEIKSTARLGMQIDASRAQDNQNAEIEAAWGDNVWKHAFQKNPV